MRQLLSCAPGDAHLCFQGASQGLMPPCDRLEAAGPASPPQHFCVLCVMAACFQHVAWNLVQLSMICEVCVTDAHLLELHSRACQWLPAALHSRVEGCLLLLLGLLRAK